MATHKLTSAKAKLARVAKRKTTPERGDAITITNRLYAIVDSRSRLQFDRGARDGEGYPDACIYSTRAMARAALRDGERIVRLSDITGVIQ